MTLCEKATPCVLCTAAGQCELDQERHSIWLLDRRLKEIGRRVLVLSNKGGVGKSTVTYNVAATLAMRGLQVGVLDADLSGPTLPLLAGVEGARMRAGEGGLVPVEPAAGLRLVSSGFFLQDQDDPIMWRDAYKFEFLTRLLADVAWGRLDLLLVDMPPGTGGELIGLNELLGRVDGAVVVTTPQRAALADGRKAIAACREAGIPVIGVVENMSGRPFGSGGGELVAVSTGVPFLGRIPLDETIAALSDAGVAPAVAEPFSSGGRALAEVGRRLEAAIRAIRR